jgi:hypothetical protein
MDERRGEMSISLLRRKKYNKRNTAYWDNLSQVRKTVKERKEQAERDNGVKITDISYSGIRFIVVQDGSIYEVVDTTEENNKTVIAKFYAEVNAKNYAEIRNG